MNKLFLTSSFTQKTISIVILIAKKCQPVSGWGAASRSPKTIKVPKSGNNTFKVLLIPRRKALSYYIHIPFLNDLINVYNSPKKVFMKHIPNIIYSIAKTYLNNIYSYFFNSIFIRFYLFQSVFKQMALNVPAVYDVFAVAIKELRSNSSNRKNVAEKKPTKGVSPTGFFRSPSRRKVAKHIQTC
jgi:hypothetical protein